MLVNALFEGKVNQLRDVAKRLHSALRDACIPYQAIGGFAVFCHVERIDPLQARLTRDIDIAIDRHDLSRIAAAVGSMGLEYRPAAGVDMLVDAAEPKARSAIHLIFVREKVRPEYLEAVPEISGPVDSEDGILIAPVGDLLRMKLTSFRLKDRVHIQDMDSVGLITAELERTLSEELRKRLQDVRQSE